MIKDKEVVEFLDSNDYYDLDSLVSLLTDIVNGVYEADTFIKDVKEYREHNQ